MRIHSKANMESKRLNHKSKQPLETIDKTSNNVWSLQVWEGVDTHTNQEDMASNWKGYET